MINKQILKKDFSRFISTLNKEYEVIGPLERKKMVIFDKIKNFDVMVLDKQTDYSAKRYFLPKNTELLKYEKDKASVDIKPVKRAIFMRACDANAIKNLDRWFIDENPDPYYKAQRENTLIFVFDCSMPIGKNCFCASLGTDKADNYDLLFIDKGDKYLVFVKSEEAKKITENELFTRVMIDASHYLKCDKKINVPYNFDDFFSHDEWKKQAEICIYCAACNITCPTCYCFDVLDEPELDTKSGARKREWAYCMMQEFTRVAGGGIFRKERHERFRNRIYHMLHYHKERFGKHLCTGCGRCITCCPKDIDMVEIVNNLK